MLNDALPHYNDNMPVVRAAEASMQQVNTSRKSRPPSMSKHFATDTQMAEAKHPALIEFEEAIDRAFAPLLPSIERDRKFHINHNED